MFVGTQGNDIARNIIGADISVFDSSDLNANVMIELGFALTWGRPILPIREENSLDLPSDLSGQTWAKYRSNAEEWLDEQHHRKIESLVFRAVRRKTGIV